MKPIYSLSFAAFIIAAMLGLRSDAASQVVQGPTKWDYRVLNQPYDLDRELSKLGEQSWELVTVIPAGENTKAVYFFKRPR